MKIVIAMDSFKGSVSSIEAGMAVRDGIVNVYPHAHVNIMPIADGGEGTVEALVEGMRGEYVQVKVTGPLGEKVNCTYGILPGGRTAIIEMAGAAGITLVAQHKRNPLFTTTYGVGEVIADAIHKGVRQFIVGIGGSATNDGGVGMLQALGYDFLDIEGNEIEHGAIGLKKLHTIIGKNALPQLRECTFNIACDVSNPLCGKNGCSSVFGPQKGADKLMISQMDKWLENYSTIASKLYSEANRDYPGAGAAGGLGFAFMTFLHGKLESGVQLIIQETGLESAIKESDFLITGEGRLDSQSIMGKAPIGAAAIAKKYGKKVIAFAGCVSKDADVCNEYGIDAYFPVIREITTYEEAMNSYIASENISKAAEQVFRLIKMEEN